MDMLGNYSSAFAALAITGKESGAGPMPCIREVESAAEAVALIQEERPGVSLSAETLREIRERIEAVQKEGRRFPGGFGWRDWVSLGAAAMLTTVMVADAPEITAGEWLPILLSLALPLAALLWLVNRIPTGWIRTTLSYVIMLLSVAVTLFLSLGAWLT